MGSSAMQSLSLLWKRKYISTTTKIRLLKALVWSVAIYESEGRTLHSKEEKYIEAFEMRCYRRLLRIPWTQHKTNEWILCKLKVDKELLDRVTVKSLKSGFYTVIRHGNTKVWRRKSFKDVYQVKEIVVDNAGVGQMTSRIGMDWDEDQWSGYSSGRSWSLERDTTRRQKPFLWRKALNDDDDEARQLSVWLMICERGWYEHCAVSDRYFIQPLLFSRPY